MQKLFIHGCVFWRQVNSRCKYSICVIHSVARLRHYFNSTNTVRCIWKSGVVFFAFFQATFCFIYSRMVINNLTYNSLLTTTKKMHSVLSKKQNSICFPWNAVLGSIRMYFATPQIRIKQHWLINVNGNAWLNTVFVPTYKPFYAPAMKWWKGI